MFEISDADELRPYAKRARDMVWQDMPELRSHSIVAGVLEQMLAEKDVIPLFFVIFMTLMVCPKYQRAFALDPLILERIQRHFDLCLQGRTITGGRCEQSTDRAHPDYRSLVCACLQLIWVSY